MSCFPRVWVIQEGRNDYSAAEEFGDVHFITKADLSKVKNSSQNAEVEQDFRKFNSQYVAGTDYIIPAGNPVVVAIYLISLSGKHHKFLKWDGRRAVYVPFEISSINN